MRSNRHILWNKDPFIEWFFLMKISKMGKSSWFSGIEWKVVLGLNRTLVSGFAFKTVGAVDQRGYGFGDAVFWF